MDLIKCGNFCVRLYWRRKCGTDVLWNDGELLLWRIQIRVSSPLSEAKRSYWALNYRSLCYHSAPDGDNTEEFSIIITFSWSAFSSSLIHHKMITFLWGGDCLAGCWGHAQILWGAVEKEAAGGVLSPQPVDRPCLDAGHLIITHVNWALGPSSLRIHHSPLAPKSRRHSSSVTGCSAFCQSISSQVSSFSLKELSGPQ